MGVARIARSPTFLCFPFVAVLVLLLALGLMGRNNYYGRTTLMEGRVIVRYEGDGYEDYHVVAQIAGQPYGVKVTQAEYVSAVAGEIRYFAVPAWRFRPDPLRKAWYNLYASFGMASFILQVCWCLIVLILVIVDAATGPPYPSPQRPFRCHTT